MPKDRVLSISVISQAWLFNFNSSSRLRFGRVLMRQRLHTIGIRLWRRLGLLRRQRRGHLPSTVNSVCISYSFCLLRNGDGSSTFQARTCICICLLLSNFLSLQIWWIEAQHKRNARAPPSARLLAPTIPSCVLINYHRFLISRLNFHPVSYHLETIVMRISFIYFVGFFYRQGVVFNFYRKNNLFLVYTD